MKNSATTTTGSASKLIDGRIKELGDWRGTTLARVRALIKQAVPDVVEEWKWRGVPVWYHNGQICTGETYKDAVKLTFMKGASVSDPSRLFNSSLEGNARRAIDIHEGDAIDEGAFKTLLRAAAALNDAPGRSAAKSGKTASAKAAKKAPAKVAKKSSTKTPAKAAKKSPSKTAKKAVGKKAAGKKAAKKRA